MPLPCGCGCSPCTPPADGRVQALSVDKLSPIDDSAAAATATSPAAAGGGGGGGMGGMLDSMLEDPDVKVRASPPAAGLSSQ